MIVPPFEFLRVGPRMRELNILAAIGEHDRISQRQLAVRARISPTMVNAYVAGLVAEGKVLMTGDSNRDMRYALTAAGCEALETLVYGCSKEAIQFYSTVKAEFQRRLRGLAGGGIRRVVLFGAAETGEVTYAACEGTALEVAGVVDNDPAKRGKRIGTCLVESPEAIPALAPDAVVITSHGHADAIAKQLAPLRAHGVRVCGIWQAAPSGRSGTADFADSGMQRGDFSEPVKTGRRGPESTKPVLQVAP